MKTHKADPETRLKSGKENFGYSSDEARAAREYQAGHRKTFRGRCGLPGHQLLKQKNLGTGSKQCLDDFLGEFLEPGVDLAVKLFLSA